MKKTFLILAAVALVSFTSCKENATDKVSEENVAAAAERDAESGKYPVMTFAETEFDFGTIDGNRAAWSADPTDRGAGHAYRLHSPVGGSSPGTSGQATTTHARGDHA